VVRRGFGNLFAAYIYDWVGPYGWRYVFFTGIVPALLLAFLRRGMVEPEHFAAVKAAPSAGGPQRPQSGGTRVPAHSAAATVQPRHSVPNAGRCAVRAGDPLGSIDSPSLAADDPEPQKEGIKGAAAIPYVSWGMKLWGIGGIVGYIAFGYIADAIGRRPTIIIYSLGTLIVGLYLFLGVSTYGPYPILLLIYGFFVAGIFSGHAIYMSELFPTHVRSTAVAFCNGSGRVFTSFGPLVAGLLVVQLGGFPMPRES
jgi:MFS family permease